MICLPLSSNIYHWIPISPQDSNILSLFNTFFQFDPSSGTFINISPPYSSLEAIASPYVW
jgi:hypothetical protein